MILPNRFEAREARRRWLLAFNDHVVSRQGHRNGLPSKRYSPENARDLCLLRTVRSVVAARLEKKVERRHISDSCGREVL